MSCQDDMTNRPAAPAREPTPLTPEVDEYAPAPHSAPEAPIWLDWAAGVRCRSVPRVLYHRFSLRRPAPKADRLVTIGCIPQSCRARQGASVSTITLDACRKCWLRGCMLCLSRQRTRLWRVATLECRLQASPHAATDQACDRPTGGADNLCTPSGCRSSVDSSERTLCSCLHGVEQARGRSESRPFRSDDASHNICLR